MQRMIFISLLFLSSVCMAQTDSSKWLRAFPVTDYIVDLNDSTKLVQLEMPDGLSVKDKQLGMLYGTYQTSGSDAVNKGYGRCQLIKSNYYYFAIGHNTSGLPIIKSDILYVQMDRTNIYFGQLPKLAAHFIRLLDVYDQPFYDRYNIFLGYTAEDEKKLVDSIVADIRFTGNYFIKNNPAMDKLIGSGDYKGKMTLSVMAACSVADVKKFFDFLIAKPRNYAGKEWKVSEIFATWVAEGSPL